MQNGTSTLEDKFGGFSSKLNILLSYDPIISLFNKKPKELKTYLYKNLHTNVNSSFIYNFQNLKLPRYPSLGEWINISGSSRQQNIIQC